VHRADCGSGLSQGASQCALGCQGGARRADPAPRGWSFRLGRNWSGRGFCGFAFALAAVEAGS
jgi:hypothetical protein